MAWSRIEIHSPLGSALRSSHEQAGPEAAQTVQRVLAAHLDAGDRTGGAVAGARILKRNSQDRQRQGFLLQEVVELLVEARYADITRGRNEVFISQIIVG